MHVESALTFTHSLHQQQLLCDDTVVPEIPPRRQIAVTHLSVRLAEKTSHRLLALTRLCKSFLVCDSSLRIGPRWTLNTGFPLGLISQA